MIEQAIFIYYNYLITLRVKELPLTITMQQFFYILYI